MSGSARLMLGVCRLSFWLVLLYVALVTLSPIALRPITPFGPNAERFAAFVVVSALAMLAFPARHPRWFWILIAAAAFLEASQNLIEGRHGRLMDFAVKVGGILAGIGIVTVLGWLGPGGDPRSRRPD